MLSYFEISLHAVSKDVANFPEECIYLMLDAGKEESEEDSEPEENGLDAEMNGGTHVPEKELYFIPNDKSKLDSIFTAMAHCQSLHPDPEDVGSDDDAMHDEEESGMGEGGGGGDLAYDYGGETRGTEAITTKTISQTTLTILAVATIRDFSVTELFLHSSHYLPRLLCYICRMNNEAYNFLMEFYCLY